VGVLALVIAALGFWDNHREHRIEERDRLAAEQRASAGPPFVLTGEALDRGTKIALRPTHDDEVIQSQTFIFPAVFRGDPVQTAGAARIEAGWCEDGLRKTKHRSAAGDLRAPVGISTTYLIDGDLRTDQSIYDISYRLEPTLLSGLHLSSGRVVLEGLSVVRRGVTGDLKSAVEAVYKARGGAAPSGPISPTKFPVQRPPSCTRKSHRPSVTLRAVVADLRSRRPSGS
jgi:hypothetical protein